jgi:Flp pilus assembly CpaE family ATPase
VDEAQSHGRTVFEWAPRSPGARALAAISDEIDGLAPAAETRRRSAGEQETRDGGGPDAPGRATSPSRGRAM